MELTIQGEAQIVADEQARDELLETILTIARWSKRSIDCHPTDGPRYRPISQDTPPPRTVAETCWPSRCSITGFHGTKLKPMPSSSIA